MDAFDGPGSGIRQADVFPLSDKSSPFTERLSWLMAIVAALGGIYVIMDPVITFDLGDAVTIKLGGDGFSEQLKGAVVALILIEGWKAVKEYWLGSSASGQKNAESVAKIAEQAAPTQALAVAAARGPAPTEAPPVTIEPVVTPAAVNPETGNTPAAEVRK